MSKSALLRPANERKNAAANSRPSLVGGLLKLSLMRSWRS